MPPQKGSRMTPDPNRDLLGHGDVVRVENYLGLPRRGEEGTVRRTVLRGGDIVLTVEFADRTREDYDEADLKRTAVATKSHKRQWEW